MRFRQSSTVIRAMVSLPGSVRSALAADDPRELLPCCIEVLVNYSVFELAGVRHFGLGVVQAALDDAFGVLVAPAQAPLQLRHRRRQDEDADAVGIERAHLPRTLPVDLEDEVLALLEGVLDGLAGGAIPVAVYLGALQELAAALHGEKGRLVHEVVLAPVLLPRARLAGGVGGRQPEAGLVFQQRLDQRGLAGARGRGDDEQAAPHSMFCTCSRTCSTSSFSSSAQSATGWLAALEARVFASRLSSWAMKSSRFPAAPPARSTRSTSARCVRRRSSSSSTSLFAANSATSARMRSSSAEPMASRRRSAIFCW